MEHPIKRLLLLLRPLGNINSALGNVKIFKEKAGCNDTLVLGD